MDLIKMALIVALVGLAALALYEARCLFGLHPHEDRRMRSGRRAKDGRGRDKAATVTEWWCLRCNRSIAVREETIDVTLLRQIQQQVGGSRARSKVINMHVVRKDNTKEQDIA
jgi:hypothetical protein